MAYSCFALLQQAGKAKLEFTTERDACTERVSSGHVYTRYNIVAFA